MSMQKLKSLSASLGAEVESELDHHSDRAITVVAPDGKQWVDGQCIHMTECYYTYIPGSRQEAIDMLITRISSGLEELDTELNP